MVELGLIILIVAIAIGAILILKSIKGFIVNAIIGLIILFLANTIAGLGIGYSWLAILICGLGGVLGAMIVIVLHIMGLGL